VRRIEARTPARFNADPRLLNDASGSAGRSVLFAVRVDTFPAESRQTMFYVGSNTEASFAALRRALLKAPVLPVSAEYIHSDAFNLAERYGRDTYLAALWLGTARLRRLLSLKGWLDGRIAAAGMGSAHFTDRVLQLAAAAIPVRLPRRLRSFRDRFQHHLLLDAAEAGIRETRKLLTDAAAAGKLSWFECTALERRRALLHRFAVAGAAIRYRALNPGRIEDVLALDVALRRDEEKWFGEPPPEVSAEVESVIDGTLRGLMPVPRWFRLRRD
jgi:D-lactate dehydrogenase